jgi:ABC-type branched-subunit amino acid transport system substrate-binding protein
MKRISFFVFAFFLLLFSAQAQTMQRQKIAIFTPLYLDSAVNGAGEVKLEKNALPKYLMPGLEFYQGVQAALDSFKQRNAPLEVYIYDSRGRQSIPQILARPEMKDVKLIIAQTNSAETRLLANAAFQKKVPFISATLPNDVGIANNPYFVMLNSSLLTHVEGIYKYLQKYHSGNVITMFRRGGAQQDIIKQLFVDFAKNTSTPPLRIRYVDLGTNFSAATLSTYLDSTQKNVCIAGTLNEAFAQKLTSELDKLGSSYQTTVFGMPTWDNLNFGKLQHVQVVYTAPFYYNGSTELQNNLAQAYEEAMSSKPTDMFFRGYEVTLRFALLLLDAKQDLPSNLSRKGNTVFTPFNIEPVFKDSTNMTLDYFENKHLYFIKVVGGSKNILY